MPTRRDDECEYVPTQEQIRKSSKRIQRTWSVRERRARLGLPRDEPRIVLLPLRIEIDERGTVLE